MRLGETGCDWVRLGSDSNGKKIRERARNNEK